MSEKEINLNKKDRNHIKNEHDKWKDIREARKFTDVSEMSYWNMVSKCAIL